MSFDFGIKKRKAKAIPKRQEVVDVDVVPESVTDSCPTSDSLRECGPKDRPIGTAPSLLEYSYEELLTRLYSNMPVDDKKALELHKPKLHREGKKTRWINFNYYCNTLMRPQEHLKAFISKEFSCNVNIDAENRLVMCGRFNEGHIQRILRSYILFYVECKTCKKQNTVFRTLTTGPARASNMICIHCNDCDSERHVSKKI